MLKVKTYLNVSNIPNAGIGCFAGEFIPSGTKIWEMSPLFDRIFSEDMLKNMSKHEIDFINVYAYRHNNLYYLCVDNARFFNHSEDPNTLDPSGEHCTYALKDINVGDEILSNYFTFGNNESDHEFNKII